MHNDDHLWALAKSEAAAAGRQKDYPFIMEIYRRKKGAASTMDLLKQEDVLRKGCGKPYSKSKAPPLKKDPADAKAERDAEKQANADVGVAKGKKVRTSFDSGHDHVVEVPDDDDKVSKSLFSELADLEELSKAKSSRQMGFDFSGGSSGGGVKPPAGFTAIPGGKKGGYRKKVGGRWQYWYPDGKGGQGGGNRKVKNQSEVRDAQARVEALETWPSSRAHADPAWAIAALKFHIKAAGNGDLSHGGAADQRQHKFHMDAKEFHEARSEAFAKYAEDAKAPELRTAYRKAGKAATEAAHAHWQASNGMLSSVRHAMNASQKAEKLFQDIAFWAHREATKTKSDETVASLKRRHGLDKSGGMLDELELLQKAASGKIIGRTSDGKEVYAHKAEVSDDDDEDKPQPAKAPPGKDAKGPQAGPPAGKQPPGAKDEAEADGDGGTDEGSHGHHSARALAHLQAAQAHASAAHSARKLDEAKDHKKTVANAKQMSAAAAGAASTPPGAAAMEKSVTKAGDGSLLTHDMLRKAMYGSSDVTGWAGQFYATPMYVEALGLLKKKLKVRQEYKAHDKARISWSEQDNWSRKQRDDYADKRNKDRDAIRAKEAALEELCCALEEKLLDHKIEQAKAMGKALSPEFLRDDLNKSITRMVGAAREPVIRHKNNLAINMTAEDQVLEQLEKGGLGVQAAGMPDPDGLTRLQNLRKATIYQGEHGVDSRYGETRGADFRESVARGEKWGDMIELDDAGNHGQGGLPEWFQDAWSKLTPEEQMAANAPLGGPVGTGWKKGMGADESVTIVDDDNPYQKARITGGHPAEHQSSIRVLYQGNGRQDPK